MTLDLFSLLGRTFLQMGMCLVGSMSSPLTMRNCWAKVAAPEPFVEPDSHFPPHPRW